MRWAIAHQPQKPSFQWTTGRSCTNIQPGPLNGGRPNFVIKRKTDHIDALFKRGEFFLKLKEFGKSQGDFNKIFATQKNAAVILSNKRKAKLFYLRAQAKRGLGYTENAIKDLGDASRLDARLPGTHKEMGYLMALKGDHVAALKSFNQALVLDANYADALVGRASSYFFRANMTG